MTTFTSRDSQPPTCDTCGETIPNSWRRMAAHTAAHVPQDQAAARAARAKQLTQHRATPKEQT